MNILIDFIGNFILSTSEIYVWHNISKKKFKLNNSKNLLCIFVLSVVIVLIYYYTNDFIKGFLTLLLAFIFCKVILNEKIKNCILLTFIGQLTIIVSEGIIVLFMNLLISRDAYFVANSKFAILVLSILVAILSFLISKLPILNKLYIRLLRLTNNIKTKQLLVFILFVSLGSNIFTTSVYFNDNIILKLVLNIIVSLIYTIIVVLVFNYQSKYYNVSSKYKMSLEYLKSQEKLIDNYRIINHENNNQLLTIKSMTKNKKVTGYIDSLIKKKSLYNNNVIKDSLKLPQGGIRGLIYNKLLKMKEYKIRYYLNVDKNISFKELVEIDNNDIVDICNILGVILDNAIEETKDLKNKIINITFSRAKDNLVMTISNPLYHEIKNIRDGYIIRTSKGKGHGYGLKLVKEIIDNNSKLENERDISKETFTQKIIYKM